MGGMEDIYKHKYTWYYCCRQMCGKTRVPVGYLISTESWLHGFTRLRWIYHGISLEHRDRQWVQYISQNTFFDKKFKTVRRGVEKLGWVSYKTRRVEGRDREIWGIMVLDAHFLR